MANVEYADTEHQITIRGAELAALISILATSPLLTQGDKNGKFLQEADRVLSKYYTLSELGVLPGMDPTTHSQICSRLFHELEDHVCKKMSITKEKLKCGK